MVDIKQVDDVAMPRLMTGQVDEIHTPADLIGRVVSFMLTNGSQVSGVEISGIDTYDHQPRILYRLPHTAGDSAVPVTAITHLHVARYIDHTVHIGLWSSANDIPPRTAPPRASRITGAGRCPCVCNSGGFCGGCGHAGCGGR